MIYTAAQTSSTPPIPQLDILSFLFDSPFALATDSTVLHAEAANPTNAITKAVARVWTRRIAHTLRTRFGIGQHGRGKDVVLVISSGQMMLPILFYGIIAAGGVASLASSSSTPTELATQIRQGSAKLCVSCSSTQDILLSAARLCEFPFHRCLILDSASQWRLRMLTGSSGQNIVGDAELDWERVTDREELENGLVCLLYSSGTTGTPKGVKFSHRNFVAAAIVTGSTLREHWRAIGRWEFRTLAHLPAAHIAGALGYFILPFYYGGITYWMPKFEFNDFLKFNRSLGITSFFSVPPIYLLIAKSPLVTDQFRALKSVTSGAAPLGKDLQVSASKRLGVFLAQTWAMSESTGPVSGGEVGREDLSGSTGPLLPHMEVRIVDEEGRNCPPNMPGEILVRGPTITKGYLNNPAANANGFKDGFLVTGDVGFFEGDRLHVVDRKKELIKYKGLQVAPAELEAVLISHPQILDAGVVGVYDAENATEVPRAYVVADRNAISAAVIQEFVKRRVAGHKRLRGGVEFVTAIPKSASGKILRKDLRVWARTAGVKL
ncbi:hypothetical protein C8R46DRAFT_998215 [Mycena filopes]|nr:hypothetical protein C8R46DRAFT_998215 [Mycena filopes]